MTLKFISFTGAPRERGRQHGEMMRLKIAENADFYLNYFCARGTNREAIRAETERWLEFLGRLSPDYVDELRGVAEAANLPAETVTMFNVMYELAVPLRVRQAGELSNLARGCTSVGLMPETTALSSTMLAQTIDGATVVSDTLFVGKMPASDKPSWLGVFEAGCVGPIVGLNSAGIGLVINSLLTAIDGRGPMTAPFTLQCRSILEARAFDSAIRVILARDRNTSMNYMIGHAEGEIICIETTPNDKRCLYPEGGIVTHGNHFEHGGAIVSEMERFVPSTLFRSRRLDRHLRSKLGTIDVDDIMAGLKDHFSYPASICYHPEEIASGRQSGTLAAIVMDLNRLALFATDGPPCVAPLQRFQLEP